jgi:copper chaperone CopZ/bacterioferritin-associated ferredoxin
LNNKFICGEGLELRSVSGRSFPVSEIFLKLAKEGAGTRDICPACGSRGHMVMKVTVSNHVDSSMWRLLRSEWFWFCSNPRCSIVYYNNDLGVYFLKDEVRTRVFHKEPPGDRPVCYCLSVTESLIREEIMVKKCCDSLEDIQRFTRAGTGRWCPITNPSGKCCREYLADLIHSILSERPGEPVERRLEELGRSFRLEIRSTPARGGAILLIEGMSCEGCAVAVRTALESLGVVVKGVDWKSGLAEILDMRGYNIEKIKETIEGIGYQVSRIVSE